MNSVDLKDYPRIVFYDGDCGFCSKSVQFILKNRRKSIYFMPLQHEKAKTLIKSKGFEVDMNTLFYLENNQLFQRSTAVLKISKHLKFRFRLLVVLGYILPRFLRDKIYDVVASKRFAIAGKNCYLPTEEEKELFIQ